MLELIPPQRMTDKFGSGLYHAPRGNRLHNGVDKLAVPGSQLKSLTDGRVTKLGYAYSDDLSYRYVQVSDGIGHELRYFYILPSVELGQKIVKGTVLGEVQNLDKRYPGIGNHFHFEVMHSGVYIDPEEYFASLKQDKA